MAKKKKYSLNERIKFYREKFSESSDKKQRAKINGYLDAATSSNISCGHLSSEAEKEAYYKGVNKGQKALNKASSLKW